VDQFACWAAMWRGPAGPEVGNLYIWELNGRNRCKSVGAVASKREPTTHRIVQIPLMECRLLEHESLRQRFIHAGLLKAREYAWPQVAQRIMNY